jgi:hypothetical protein
MNAILNFLINLSDSNDNFKNKLNTNDSIPYDNDNNFYSNSLKNVFSHTTVNVSVDNVKLFDSNSSPVCKFSDITDGSCSHFQNINSI